MHLGQVKSNMGLFFILKAYEPACYIIIIKERKFVFPHFYPLCNAGHFVEVVIIAQTVLMNDLIHQLAAFAAKALIIQCYPGGNAFLAAMAA